MTLSFVRIFAGGLALVMTACATAPYTHRRQFMMVSEDQEMELGKEAYKEVLKKEKLSNDARTNEIVKRVGERIAQAARSDADPAIAERAKRYEWQFVVVDAPKTVNAFCLPGGKVAFYTGIMPVCQDEEGIAVVMGHEVAHALVRHGAERMSQGLGAELLGTTLAIAVANKTPEAQRSIMDVYGLTANVGVLLPFSRTHESEADRVGLILMAKAGYNPQTAVSFWKRMAGESGGKKPPEFLSTHPSDETRINKIQAWLPEAYKYYQK